MTSLVPETTRKVFTPETLRTAAKQSLRLHIVPIPLRKSIKKFLREQDLSYLKRKVLRLTQSFDIIKNVNLQLPATTAKELVEDPLKDLNRSKRWKVKSSYGDIGLKYEDDQALAYVAARMPSVYSACYRVLSEVHRRLPDLSPTKVLDFGAGTGSALWAMREVWPQAVKKINLVEPSKSMQRVGLNLLRGQTDLPFIQGYDTLLALSKKLKKSEREHDLVIASYVLGEIPSLRDRITTVRQLWNLTRDVLVLLEPGSPYGSNIISQARSHILWMEKRKSLKAKAAAKKDSKALVPYKSGGAYVLAPCPHDGPCPLRGGSKYCHFVQRLQRTSTQRIFKRTRKGQPLRGYEDEKFSFVVLKRGQRPQEPWPLDDMILETLNEQKARRTPEYYEIELEDLYKSKVDKNQYKKISPKYESDMSETDAIDEIDEGETGGGEGEEAEVQEGEEIDEDEPDSAGLGGGWGRIIYEPLRRGRLVELDVCRSTKRDCSGGCFERVRVTRSKNPTLHRQAKKSTWGDLWPC